MAAEALIFAQGVNHKIMLIFLYGPDTYRSRQKLNGLVEQYKKVNRGALNLKYFDFEKDDFKIVKEEFQQPSMFQEKKLLIFKNAFSNAEFREEFLKNKESFSGFWADKNNTIIFYEEGEVNKNSRLLNFLQKEAKCQKFEHLTGEKLKNWLMKEFKNLGGEIKDAALNKLVEFAGDDSWRLSNEINKLVNYKAGLAVEEKDVELLVSPRIETDIFQTIDCLAQKNKKEALKMLHRHLENGDSPFYILSMINFQFRNLLIIKSLSQKYPSFYPIAKVSGLHPFVVKKGYFLAQKFKLDELKKIYQKIFEIDSKIKTGRMEPVAALDLFVAGI